MARIIDAPLTSGEGPGCDPRAVHGAWAPSTPPPVVGWPIRQRSPRKPRRSTSA